MTELNRPDTPSEPGAVEPHPAAGPHPATGSHPAVLRLERRADQQIWLVREGADDVAVRVRRPFPWSMPGRYFSLCDEKDNEVALIVDEDDLDPDSRRVLEEALQETRFLFEVEGIEAIETEFEIRNWKVRTRQGFCTFQTKHDEWPHPLPQGGFVLRGIEGNLFHIPDLDQMDEKSRKLMWDFTD